MNAGSSRFLFWVIQGILLSAVAALADDHVSVVADAGDNYLRRRSESGSPRVETYVFMETRPYGGATRDASLSKITVRDVALALAPELAKAHYMPAADLKSADLILAVHWGATRPRMSFDEMSANSTPAAVPASKQEQQENDGFGVNRATSMADEAWFDRAQRFTDGVGANMDDQFNARLLGYTEELRKLARKPLSTNDELVLLSDVQSERYFVIVNAYEIHRKRVPGKPPRPAWTIHLNMRAAGQNFTTALARMSNVAVDYFGERLEGVKSVRPTERHGEVTVGPLTIIGITE